MSFPTVGVVGAGQLARMLAPPAVALGVRLRVLAASPDDAAAQVIPDTVVGPYDDLDVLREFAAGVDVLTFDHEHVPTAHLRALESDGVCVRPGPGALEHAADKLLMRARLDSAGVPMPAWQAVSSPSEVAAFAEQVGWPVVVKTPRGGYDGKGVRVVSGPHEVTAVGDWWASGPLLVEEHVPFVGEVAALVARSPHGQAVAYPVVETRQTGGVCREVVAPARLDPDEAMAAQRVAMAVAAELDVVGVLAVEMFDLGGRVVVNELAMRPHNSGHWSIEGAVTSQFENHLRAVLDLPLGDPRPTSPYTVMVNVFGGDYPDLYPAYRHVMARDPGAHVHVYGKQVRAGRKIGHVTVTGDDVDELLERARHAAGYLRGEITQ